MRHYRCYFWTHEGHIARAEAGAHPDDETARLWAKERFNASQGCKRVELWQRDRLIERWLTAAEAPLTAQECRALADHYRRRAEEAANPDDRSPLLVIAEQYGKLADAIEQEGP